MATSTKDSGYVDNWQVGKTVTECNLHMLTTEDCSDVIFRVGSGKHVVRAHRYVLVSRSCVFHAMFCGPLAEKGEITIPDIEAHVFKEFLRYLYTDMININEDNVTGLLYTSRKYAVDNLLNKCSSYLEESLSEVNVCQILERCHDYGDPELEQKALKILTEAGEEVIKSPGFLALCETCVGKFLKSEELKLREEDIFEATLSWASERCKNDNVSASLKNLRKYLGDMIYEIRFASFNQEYLVNVVGPSGVLTNDERIRIMDRNINSSVDITPFKSCLRVNSKGNPYLPECSPCLQVHRYHVNKSGWRVIGNQEAIAFYVNKKIKLYGCQLYGPAHKTESTYKLTILIYDDKDLVIAEPVERTDVVLRDQRELNDIIFPDIVQIMADRTYTICVSLTGEKTDYGGEGQTTVNVDGVVFTFMDSPKSTKRWTTLKRGQIPGLLFKQCCN